MTKSYPHNLVNHLILIYSKKPYTEARFRLTIDNREWASVVGTFVVFTTILVIQLSHSVYT